jgi:hypothetical protein
MPFTKRAVMRYPNKPGVIAVVAQAVGTIAPCPVEA